MCVLRPWNCMLLKVSHVILRHFTIIARFISFNLTLLCHYASLFQKNMLSYVFISTIGVIQIKVYWSHKYFCRFWSCPSCESPLTLSQTTNFRLFRTQSFCRWQIQIWCKWHKVFQIVRKHYGKRRICSLWAISTFSTVFSKDLYWRHVKTGACLGKG